MRWLASLLALVVSLPCMAAHYAEQSDGKILIQAGPSLWRVSPNGAQDRHFGTTSSNGLIEGRDVDVNFEDLLLLANEKILLAGRDYYDHDHLAVVRLQRDGLIDLTFGDEGVVKVNVGPADIGRVVKMEGTADAFFVLFWQNTADQYALRVARFHLDGSLDSRFGQGGLVTVATDFESRGLALRLQRDGKVLVGFHTYRPGSEVPTKILRFDETGALDSSFGTGGIFSLQTVGQGYFLDMQVGPDGKIYFVQEGDILEGEDQPGSVRRLLENGVLDTSFGANGVFSLPLGRDALSRAEFIAMDGPDLVVAGFYADGLMHISKAGGSGHIDQSFGEQGQVYIGIQNFQLLKSLFVLRDGRILSDSGSVVRCIEPDGQHYCLFGNQGAITYPF